MRDRPHVRERRGGLRKTIWEFGRIPAVAGVDELDFASRIRESIQGYRRIQDKIRVC
jgi:hypothetical protein